MGSGCSATMVPPTSPSAHPLPIQVQEQGSKQEKILFILLNHLLPFTEIISQPPQRWDLEQKEGQEGLETICLRHHQGPADQPVFHAGGTLQGLILSRRARASLGHSGSCSPGLRQQLSSAGSSPICPWTNRCL